MTRREILIKAIECVCGGRSQDYGSPEDCFHTIAEYWSCYLKVKITPHDVSILMALLKIGRIQHGKFKLDSYADACGYIACAGEVEK